MSLSETELIYLMAYVDGQVDDDELPEVTALLERSEEARQIVAQHAALGDWVRESSDARAAEGGADLIAGHVLAEIEKLGGGKVIGIERDRAKVALQRQRVKELGALLAVAAAAAAFWLMPAKDSQTVALSKGAQRESGLVGSSSASGARERAPLPEHAELATAAPSPDTANPDPTGKASGEADETGVDIQSVESPAHPFSIFYVPAATGLNPHSSSVVVWVAE